MISNPLVLSEMILAAVAGLFVGRLFSARIIGALLSVFFGFVILKIVLNLLLNPSPSLSLFQIQENLSRIIAHNGAAVIIFGSSPD